MMMIDPSILIARHFWSILVVGWKSMSWASKVQWFILGWLILRDSKRQKRYERMLDILLDDSEKERLKKPKATKTK